MGNALLVPSRAVINYNETAVLLENTPGKLVTVELIFAGSGVNAGEEMRR